MKFFKGKEEDIMIDVKKSDYQEENDAEINLYYYLDICKKSVSEVSKIVTTQLFEFQMYNQVLELIENIDSQSAATALQIITEIQKDCEQLQTQDLRQSIYLLNCLFKITVDIYDPEKPNFFARFKQSHQTLNQFLKKILEGKIRKSQKSHEILFNEIKKEQNEVIDHNEQNIIVKIEKPQYQQQIDDAEISLYYYIDKCQESVFLISQFVSIKLFDPLLYNQVISHIQDVDMESATAKMRRVEDMQRNCEQLQVTDNSKFRYALDGLNNLFKIILDIYDPGETNFSHRFKQGFRKLKEFMKNVDKMRESSEF